MDEVLTLLKLNLGITHDLRDELLIAEINATKEELNGKKINLNLEKAEDKILLLDLVLWRHKKQDENIALPKSIDYRIKNKIVKSRAKNV